MGLRFIAVAFAVLWVACAADTAQPRRSPVVHSSIGSRVGPGVSSCAQRRRKSVHTPRMDSTHVDAHGAPHVRAHGRVMELRGGAEKPLTMDRSALGTLVLLLKAFVQSMVDPTYMMEHTEGGGAAEAQSSTDNPFAARAKAGVTQTSRTITVDELDKLGGGTKKVKAVKSAGDMSKLLSKAGRKLVVVDFFATWCGPCKQIAPKFADLSGNYGNKVHFLKVDVDQCKDLAQKYSVSSMPTFVFLKNGKELDRLSGASIDAVKQKVDSLM